MKILIVEDNPLIAESFAEVFRRCGHLVETIGYAGRCIDTMRKDFKPDRLLIDASLMSDFINKVRRAFPVPTVGITAGEVEKHPLTGVEVLRKPVEPVIVLAALEHAGSRSCDGIH